MLQIYEGPQWVGSGRSAHTHHPWLLCPLCGLVKPNSLVFGLALGGVAVGYQESSL